MDALRREQRSVAVQLADLERQEAVYQYISSGEDEERGNY